MIGQSLRHDGPRREVSTGRIITRRLAAGPFQLRSKPITPYRTQSVGTNIRRPLRESAGLFHLDGGWNRHLPKRGNAGRGRLHLKVFQQNSAHLADRFGILLDTVIGPDDQLRLHAVEMRAAVDETTPSVDCGIVGSGRMLPMIEWKDDSSLQGCIFKKGLGARRRSRGRACRCSSAGGAGSGDRSKASGLSFDERE